MRLSLKKIVLAIFFLPVLAAAQTSVPGKSPRSSAPAAGSPQSAAPNVIARPSPTPAPPTPNPAQASAPTINAPQYSPTQLDFGALWDGDSAKKTFSLVTPAAGMVTLAFPGGGNFWLTEFRELAPIQGPSKNNPAGHLGGLGTGGVKSRTTYPPGIPVSPYLQWNLAAGSEVQFDIVFKPLYQPDGPKGGTNPTGLKSIIMKVSGPGPITPWSVLVPIRGTFNGPKKLDLSPQPPITDSKNSGTQAAVASMYKGVLGRPADQSGSSAPGTSATQSVSGQQSSSASGKPATQSAYKDALGRSSSNGPPASSVALPPAKAGKAEMQSAPAQVPSPTSEVLPTSKVSKSDKMSAPAQVPSSTSQVLPRAKVSKSDKLSAPAQPPPAPLPPSSAFVDNTPQHSPDQFDFGEVWDGDSAKKTLSLTTNAAGYVTIQIPKGPFRVAAFRELGAVQLPSKNQGKQGVNIGPSQPVKSKITYLDGQSGQFQWSMAPGVDIQIDIAFQPHFNLFTETAGQKSAAMKVTGPGPKGNWAISIPLRGMFDGLRVTAPITVDPKMVVAVPGDTGTWVEITVTGLGADVSGTVRAEGPLPSGLSVVPTSVSVPAGKSKKVKVPILLGSIPADGVARPFQIAFDDGSKSSKAQIDFLGLPNTKTISSGKRGDCGVSSAQLALELRAPTESRILDSQGHPTGQKPNSGLTADFRGSNFDLINRRHVWMVAESGGVGLFSETFTLYENKVDETKDRRQFRMFVTREEWALILQGPARFGCQPSDNAFPPESENLKWANAVP